MPLFKMSGDSLTTVAQSEFVDERALQRLIEQNLRVVFNSRFIATEFRTGAVHSGRIDTLALSEDGNPVIIEYKKVPSSELINQSLFYLSWIRDHHGDFEIAAQKALGAGVEIDWSDVRVICLAPSYKKYDLHAVQVMGANLELWTYRRFANDVLFLEEVFQSSPLEPAPTVDRKDPVMVAAGKKAAITKAIGGWTFEHHTRGKPGPIAELLVEIQEFMLGLDPTIEESPKKLYIAYRTSQNIACVEAQQRKILVFLKLDPKQHPGPPGMSRDVSSIGHFGTGDLEISIRTHQDLELAKPMLKTAYEMIGG